MAMREQDERIELVVEQLSYVAGPADRLRAARRLWAATRRTARAAADERARSAAPATSDAPVATVAGGTMFRRVIDVPGTRLEDVLRSWWFRSCHDDGHLRFDRLTHDHGLCELDGSLRTSAITRRIPIEVRLSPYLTCWSFLELTPQRATHPSRAYFRVGHDSLDRFVAAICALV